MKHINEANLKETIQSIISNSKSEDNYFDFKESWYSKENKPNMLIDITSFANSSYSKYSYIIIGVDDHGNIKGVIDEESVAKKNDFVQSTIKDAKFSGENRPEFYVTSFSIDGFRIDVIVIDSNSEKAPFFLKKIYQPIKDGPYAGIGIFSRTNAINSPRDENADYPAIEEVWRRHFDKIGKVSPLEEISHFLFNVERWIDNQDDIGFDSLYFYEENPAYAIAIERNSEEYSPKNQTIYQVIQTDNVPYYCPLKLLMWNRTLYACEIRSLDEGRMYIPVPKKGFIDKKESMDAISYRYFTKDSIDYALIYFFYNRDFNLETDVAFKKAMNVIDLYQDENEATEFKEDIEMQPALLEDKIQSLLNDSCFKGYLYIRGEDSASKSLRYQLASSMAMIELHKDWRRKKNYRLIRFDFLKP